MENVTSPKATRKEWIGLVVLALPCLLYSMDLTVLNLAVPHLTASLRPSSAQLLWIVDIYGFMLAGSLITMGTLGDRIGRRRLLMIGAGAFGLASVLAAFSTTAPMLIVTRALLGIAGATLAPSTLSLIRNMFADEHQRNTAIGLWGASFAAGGAIGPLVGGVLLEHFWWGSVFLVGVPVMLLLLAIGPRLLPEFRDPDAGRLDLRSAAMSMAAVLAVIYGLKQIAQNGVSATALACIAGGIIAGVLFIRRERSLTDPLIDVRLFRIPAFSASIVTNLLVLFVTFGTFLFLAQYMQLVLGYSPLHAGLWMLPAGAAAFTGSLLVPVLLRRVRPATAMLGGLVLMAIGLAFLTQVSAASGLVWVVASSVALPLGICPVVLVTTGLVVGIAPPERAGAAAAIAETGTEFGGALGIAVLGSIGTAIYRSRMSGATHPAARETIGGALSVAPRLSRTAATELLDAARFAFTQGLRVAAAVGVLVAVAVAIVVAIVLRAPAAPTPDVELAVDPSAS